MLSSCLVRRYDCCYGELSTTRVVEFHINHLQHPNYVTLVAKSLHMYLGCIQCRNFLGTTKTGKSTKGPDTKWP
jgi:hypothetical protein